MTRPVHSILFFCACALIVNVIQACVSHDFSSYTPCDEDAQVSFQLDVKPIVETKCAISGCHDGSTDLPNWKDFATFQEEARNGSVKNFVVNRIMPKAGSPAGPLSQDQINTIACWIDHGSLDN